MDELANSQLVERMNLSNHVKLGSIREVRPFCELSFNEFVHLTSWDLASSDSATSHNIFKSSLFNFFVFL